ncbi:MAG: TraE/TraK family type IV conjugative transfer system protein [Nitrospira sp.]|mgnify:CR=1 FL=1
MKIELWKSKIHNGQVMTYLLGLCVLGLVVALIANGMFRRNTILHVVPMEIGQPYWASSMESSEEYRKQIALSIVGWVSNVTPVTVDYTHKLFLQYVPPDQYGTLSEDLGVEALYVKKNNLNRVFFPSATRVTDDEVIIQGMERRFVGKTETQEEEREYHVRLRMEGFKPLVVSIKAVHLDRTNSADVKAGLVPPEKKG